MQGSPVERLIVVREVGEFVGVCLDSRDALLFDIMYNAVVVQVLVAHRTVELTTLRNSVNGYAHGSLCRQQRAGRLTFNALADFNGQSVPWNSVLILASVLCHDS